MTKVQIEFKASSLVVEVNDVVSTFDVASVTGIRTPMKQHALIGNGVESEANHLTIPYNSTARCLTPSPNQAA